MLGTIRAGVVICKGDILQTYEWLGDRYDWLDYSEINHSNDIAYLELLYRQRDARTRYRIVRPDRDGNRIHIY